MKIEHDLHIHTYLSGCCVEKQLQTPAKIIPLAEKMGMKTIGFVDHLWMNPAIPPNPWYKPQDESQVTKLKQDLSTIKTKMRVLVGCEADTMAPGKFSITKEFAKTLDYVLLSCSHIHLDDFAQPKSRAPRDVAEHLVKMLLSGVNSGIATIIAHPFGLFGSYHGLHDDLVKTLSDTELLMVFGAASKKGIAIEINAAAVALRDSPIRLISLAKKAGCKFTFGSDAHGPAGQQAIMKMQAFLDEVGITEEDILPLAK